ncbi:putative cellulose synthase [Klebsiella pneumoniae subsp. pneumoniae]|nr:putative cellulose synthase [Klebsiella pneumoniae subsp. pneumoniae]
MKRKIIITMKNTRRLTTFCLTGALTLAASGGALASGNDAALQALFAQANYWHEKSHDELAMESLQKVLSVDANNTQALYLMALWSQQGGDMQAAAQWRARLAKAAPDSPGLQDLDNAKKMSQVPQGQLNLARQQARGGNIPGALATWRSMFNGNTPPAGLAAEYYLTMASRQIALSAGYQRAAPVRGAASAGERPAGGVGQSVNLAGRDSPGRDRPARADGQRQ